MSSSYDDLPDLLKPAEVAALFGVDAKSVTRWARSGRITAIKTLGGHRRFHKDEVLQALKDSVENVTPA